MLNEDFDISGDIKNVGIRNLDQYLNGVEPGIILIKGEPGVGKTALCLQIAKDNVGTSLYINMEMQTPALLRRFAARVNHERLSDITQGTLNPSFVSRINETTKSALANVDILNGVNNYISIDFIRDRVNQLKESGQTDFIIFLDSFHKFVEKARPHFKDLSLAELKNKLADDLSVLASELDVPLVIVCQSDEVTLDYSANVIIRLNNELDGKLDKDGYRRLCATFEKNRNGKSGKAFIKFHTEFQEFAS